MISKPDNGEHKRIAGFPPIAAQNAKLLILGSMPSEASLRKGQYYGHQRNTFWLIMGELFGAAPQLDYQLRQEILMQNGIAVWDVMKTCMRDGSMDADIQASSIETNDFVQFFRSHPGIHWVYFNGGAAEKIYRTRVLPMIKKHFGYLNYHRLPSTSPAFAAMGPAQKIEAWKAIKEILPAV